MKNALYQKRHRRRSIRLKGHDYSQPGLYFPTICVQNRLCLFGKIINKKMILNDAGKMIQKEWLKIPERFPNIKLHAFIIMPNHFHAIIEITEQAFHSKKTTLINSELTQIENRPIVLGDIVGAFQSITAVEYIRGVKEFNWERFIKKLWQRDYFERIIRNEKMYNNISNYIITNPENWEKDNLHFHQ